MSGGSRTGLVSGYYALHGAPLGKDLSIEKIEKYPWPDPYNPPRLVGVKEEIENLYKNTNYAIVAHRPVYGNLWEMTRALVRMENALLLTIADTHIFDYLLGKLDAEYAYVQPHSGIDANLVAFWSILAHRVETPGLEKYGAKSVNDLSEADWFALRRELGNQRMLGMSLDAGGHLTHGFRPNISGKMFAQRSYGTDPATALVDYDKVAGAAREFKPLILVAGYYVAVTSVRLRLDPDNHGVPILTALLDVSGVSAILFVMAISGVI